MESDMVRIQELMTMALGDEKHNVSAESTLDVLWVLYDRILHYDPKHPRSEDRDRFVLSKGHGCVAFYAILADKGFFFMLFPGCFLCVWTGGADFQSGCTH